MGMKTKHIPLTILFGLLFAVAGSNAFAGEKPALESLQAGPWGNVSAADVKIELPPPGTNDAKTQAALTKDTKAAATPVGAGTVKAAEPPPVPTAKEKIKEFVGEHKTQIFGAALGGYLGFALFGPVGILLGALFMLTVMYTAGA